MAPLASIFKKAYWTLFLGFALYSVALIASTIPWLQRHAIFVHKLHTAYWVDISKPEQFGFARNQVTPFNFSTPDYETIYAWHVMPLGLYAKHEAEILQDPPGLAEDITKTKAFNLLSTDPDARLIINFHGNAGSVAQGWRTDSYRAISDGSTSNIHILTIDYRGYGLSTGSPTEDGVIMDGVATVRWAMEVAKIPANRIVLIGQSLGTAVTIAVAEHYAKQSIDFAGIIVIAGFSGMPNLLTEYRIGGVIPILSPLKRYPTLLKFIQGFIVDKWPSAERLANLVKLSKRLRVFIIHAKNDHEIPWNQSNLLFAAAANATIDGGMDVALFEKMKARSTVDMGDGAFISTWKASKDKVIREEIVAHGGHNRILTYAPVALAALKAFDMDDGKALPV